MRGDIRFRQVTFGYENDAKVPKGVDLKIRAGETVAFVGPSGAGKTTLCSLLPRFYEPEAGTITVDGIDIKRMKLAILRGQIGILQQDVFLFSGTIRENIANGKKQASKEDIWEAFIRDLPGGLNTIVGERGMKLSGGQKQRLAIARIFLKNPPILILDEATSALDTETEKAIQQSLECIAPAADAGKDGGGRVQRKARQKVAVRKDDFVRQISRGRAAFHAAPVQAVDNRSVRGDAERVAVIEVAVHLDDVLPAPLRRCGVELGIVEVQQVADVLFFGGRFPGRKQIVLGMPVVQEQPGEEPVEIGGPNRIENAFVSHDDGGGGALGGVHGAVYENIPDRVRRRDAVPQLESSRRGQNPELPVALGSVKVGEPQPAAAHRFGSGHDGGPQLHLEP
ncbi:ATP-binding cassette domain-containing protein [Cohnella sp. CBP 2801]|uniref:ATP-binding cassette domain-containing protein n=1 Tax=Cohnella zeiphila TaxID=2761120 RepID=A0A7X0SN96_9BACL|nr:ATP-binding cassette domain-containing protein [Cohnella zeiphila]